MANMPIWHRCVISAVDSCADKREISSKFVSGNFGAGHANGPNRHVRIFRRFCAPFLAFRCGSRCSYILLTGDEGFESFSLQQRVCNPVPLSRNDIADRQGSIPKNQASPAAATPQPKRTGDRREFIDSCCRSPSLQPAERRGKGVQQPHPRAPDTELLDKGTCRQGESGSA